jgi:hypothetical protein
VASNPSGESIRTSFAAYDSLGTPLTVDVTAVLESRGDEGNTWRFFATSGDDSDASLVVGNGTLTFGSDGQLKASTARTSPSTVPAPGRRRRWRCARLLVDDRLTSRDSRW